MRSSVRLPLFAALFFLSTLSVAAQSVHSTPGSFAQYGVPSGWQHNYDQVADTLVLLEPGFRQIIVFVWAPGATDEAVANLLYELGGHSYVGEIRQTSVAGYRGSDVRIDAGGGSKDWIAALQVDELLVGIWAKTAGDFADLIDPTETLLRSLTLATPTVPDLVPGTYQTGGMASTDWDGDGLFSEQYVTLSPNGYAERGGNVGGQVGSVSASGESATSGIRWEVRGNRLLFFGNGEFLNFGMQVFGNGLELYDQEGYRYLWVRQ